MAGENRREGPRRTAPVGATTAARRTESRWLSIPWIGILFLTATFHFYRGVPVDGWIFLVLGLALTVDLARKTRAESLTAVLPAMLPTSGSAALAPQAARASSPARIWLMGGVFAAATALVWVVLLLAPAASIGVPAVVGLVGVVMLLVAWPDPPAVHASAVASPRGREGQEGRDPAPRVRRAAYWWAGVVLFLCVWELGTYFIDRMAPTDEDAYPPLSDLLGPLFTAGSSRWFMTALWLVACAALLRQVRRA